MDVAREMALWMAETRLDSKRGFDAYRDRDSEHTVTARVWIYSAATAASQVMQQHTEAVPDVFGTGSATEGTDDDAVQVQGAAAAARHNHDIVTPRASQRRP